MKRVWLLLVCCFSLCSWPVIAKQPLGRVVGQIDCQSVAECPGVAALWSVANGVVPDPRNFTVVPFVVSALKENGAFELIAPPGEYYLGAQLRVVSGASLGPPQSGDLVYFVGEDGSGYRVSVVADGVTDVGLEKVFWTFTKMNSTPEMGISGQVVDLDGQPVAGLLVFAFADQKVSDSPLAVSGRTEKDGSFVLPLARSGAVYLRVRKNLRGGLADPGDYIGVYGGDSPEAVTVEPDQVRNGLKVTVRKLPSVLTRKNAPDTARPRIDGN